MQMHVVDDEVYTFHAFYERYRRPIHSYVFRMLNSQEDANDVTQEVFVLLQLGQVVTRHAQEAESPVAARDRVA